VIGWAWVRLDVAATLVMNCFVIEASQELPSDITDATKLRCV